MWTVRRIRVKRATKSAVEQNAAELEIAAVERNGLILPRQHEQNIAPTVDLQRSGGDRADRVQARSDIHPLAWRSDERRAVWNVAPSNSRKQKRVSPSYALNKQHNNAEQDRPAAQALIVANRTRKLQPHIELCGDRVRWKINVVSVVAPAAEVTVQIRRCV